MKPNIAPNSSEVVNVAQAHAYYRHADGPNYQGLPALSLSPEAFVAVWPIFEKFRRVSPAEFADLWLLVADGEVLVTTHLDHATPGHAFRDFLRTQASVGFAASFTAEWAVLADTLMQHKRTRVA